MRKQLPTRSIGLYICPLIPANAGTLVIKRCGSNTLAPKPHRAAPYDLDPGIRRDERNTSKPYRAVQVGPAQWEGA